MGVPGQPREDQKSIFEDCLLHISLYHFLAETGYTKLRSFRECVPQPFLRSCKLSQHKDQICFQVLFYKLELMVYRDVESIHDCEYESPKCRIQKLVYQPYLLYSQVTTRLNYIYSPEGMCILTQANQEIMGVAF